VPLNNCGYWQSRVSDEGSCSQILTRDDFAVVDISQVVNPLRVAQTGFDSACTAREVLEYAKTTLLSSCCVRAELRFDGCTVDQGRYRCDPALTEVIEDVLREAESFAVR
jgi:hypothetical protein